MFEVQTSVMGERMARTRTGSAQRRPPHGLTLSTDFVRRWGVVEAA